MKTLNKLTLWACAAIACIALLGFAQGIVNAGELALALLAAAGGAAVALTDNKGA